MSAAELRHRAASRGELALACAVLALPVALAPFAGAYFDRARLVGGLVAWGLVALLAGGARRVLGASTAGRVALAGLLGYVVWTALSLAWAPLGAPALDDLQRAVLYAGYVVAAALALQPRAAARLAEPVLAAGAAIVVVYGLAPRMLPDVVTLERSLSAGGRLEQPLTYWNAMGALAALGLILAARVASDPTRATWLRAEAAAVCAPLAAGLYLTFSRGAIATAVVGIALLVLFAGPALRPRALAIALCSGLAAVLVTLPLDAVRTLEGSAAERRWQGALLLAAFLAIGLIAGRLVRRPVPRGARGESSPAGGGGSGPSRGAPRGWVVGLAAAAVVVAAVLGAAALERGPAVGTPAFGAQPQRLASLESTRYEYWEAAVAIWADHPLRGTGAAGFRVQWLQRRTIPDPARDAHSLYLETAAELGLAGLALLLLFLGGVAASARAAVRADPLAAAGPAAAFAAFAMHAALDWDWEMPALTLVALACAGLLVAQARPLGAPAALSPRR